MYCQNYEDYMRSILGYPVERVNTYEAYPYAMTSFENIQNYSNTPRYSNEIINLYPEIYKIVNPMVCKICDANTKPITRELVDQMTNEIYINLETQPEIDTIVNVRVNTTSTTRNTKETENKELKEKREALKEDRQRRPDDRILRDLISILILNRLLSMDITNMSHFSTRPPMRPPFPRENRIYEQYF